VRQTVLRLPPKLDPAELSQWARACLGRAKELFDPANSEDDARTVLQRLVEDRAVRIKHRHAVRAIRRVLAVDMSKESNRKGKLPIALGFVSRRNPQRAAQHRAIVMMMHRLKEYSVIDKRHHEPVFPYASIRKAAEAVVVGFYESGIDPKLTPENVEKIRKRQPLAQP